MDEKIGVYICECGPNIADRIDIDKILEKITSLENIKTAKKFKLLCSNEGKKFLADEIKNEELTHLVIAACSPRDHEVTFMNVCQEAGLNPYLFQLVNIREQCAWIISNKEEATRMATKYILAGINRVMLHKPLQKKELESNTDILVIGGGVAGIEASLFLASSKRKLYLVEKIKDLGGMVTKLAGLLPYQGTSLSLVQKKIEKIQNHKNIEVLISSEVEEVRGFFGNFEVVIKGNSNGSARREIKVGAIIVTTGFKLFDPKETPHYGYGTVENVVSALEFEEMSTSDKILLKNGKPPKTAALIHCVGRKEKGYCSKVCCLYSLRFAQFLRDKLSGGNVFEFYSDLCLPHKDDQEYFVETKKKGINFIRAKEIEIKKNNSHINIEYKASAGKKESLSVDMVILAPAMVPSEDTSKLAKILNIPLDETGFFKEVHEKLNPISTPIEGIYIAGCASGPKNIPESITQSQAVAGKILSSLIPGKKLEPEVKISEIVEEFCTGCQSCLSVCFYGAISFDEYKGVSVVNEAICRGCGSCVGICPSGAIRSKQFTYPQLYREILEALR